jgi:CBS domain-containing protein
MTVRKAMTKKVAYCHPETNLAAVTALIWENNCGAVPVVNEQGKLAGIITDRDICVALGTRNVRASELKAGQVASQHVHTCAPDDDLHTAFRTMSREKLRRLPVVSNDGTLQGILCFSDIVLNAQHCDGTSWPAISFEDVVNTYRAICRHGSRPVEQKTAA